MAPYNILISSDFFFPDVGGVETYMIALGEQLQAMGYGVVYMTRMRQGLKGIHYLKNGLKVYYMPFVYKATRVVFASLMFSRIPLFRNIFLRENISVIHVQGEVSPLNWSVASIGAVMGIPVVSTAHSIMSLKDLGDILLNKCLMAYYIGIQQEITVSHTSKESLVLRRRVDPNRISVIPNAVHWSRFTPQPATRDPSHITLIYCARLTERKGYPLLVKLIPKVCKAWPKVRWIVGGDGEGRLDLEEMIEDHDLQGQVTMLGQVSPLRVRDVLVQGDIFVNTSVSEAFCMAVVEAASCGLQVVSTNVGGIPEVLPSTMIRLSAPEVGSMLQTIGRAVERAGHRTPADFHAQHREVSQFYSWRDVAERTLKVYEKVREKPPPPPLELIKRLYGLGDLFGPIAMAWFAYGITIHFITCLIWPKVDTQTGSG